MTTLHMDNAITNPVKRWVLCGSKYSRVPKKTTEKLDITNTIIAPSKTYFLFVIIKQILWAY